MLEVSFNHLTYWGALTSLVATTYFDAFKLQRRALSSRES
jgi:hypothetical protein